MTFSDRIYLLKLNLNWFTEYAVKQVFITLLEAFAVSFLWNHVLPDLFSVKEITYGNAVLLILLCKILTRSWQDSLIKANLMNINIATNNTNAYLVSLINIVALASKLTALNTENNLKQKQEDTTTPEEKL